MISELFSVEGKKIAITGASGHLGRELAIALAASGADLILTDRDPGGLKTLKASLEARFDGDFRVFVADLENEKERSLLIKAVSGATQTLSGLVHNAAFVGTSELNGWAVGFKDQSLETWRRAFEVNLTAPFHLTQGLMPLLDAAEKASIVSIGSIHGLAGPDWALYEGLDMASPAAYSVSKAGIIHLTAWLAATLAPGIRCNAVSPGGIFREQDRQFVDRYSKSTAMGTMASEQDVVGAVLYLLSDASRYVTGQNIIVDGGYTL